MTLAVPVFHPHVPGTVLLREGVALDEHAIPKLRDLGVHEVWIRHPGTEDLAKFTSPHLLEAYRDLTIRVGAALDSAFVQSRVELDYFAYRKAVMGILDELAANPQAAIFMADLAGGDRPFLRHCGNVCVLSVLMGLKLDFYLMRERTRLSGIAAKDVGALGVGAMFHDIGMTRLGAPVLERWNAEHDETDEQWRAHVRIGFDLVKDHVEPSSAAVVLNHHQRYDGAGFPAREVFGGGTRGVAGSDIHIYARIVAVADAFERERHPAHAPGAQAERTPSIPAVRALRHLLEPARRAALDPIVLKALFAVAPPYPPGTVVTLSNARRAVVVGVNPDAPCRPVVHLMSENPLRRRAAREERVDLRREPDVRIIEADGFDVRDDHFEPAEDAEFDLARAGRAMMNAARENKPGQPSAA